MSNVVGTGRYCFILPGWPSLILDTFRHFLNKGSFVLVCGDREFKVEPKIISSNSYFFRNQVRINQQTRRVTVTLCSPTELELILKLVHGCYVCIEDVQEAWNFRVLLFRFGIEVTCSVLGN